MIRITKNRPKANRAFLWGISWITRGVGKRSATSTSKIRNTIARRKNRSEKGVRAVFLGSNPHSNGEEVSVEITCREATMKATIVRSNGRAIAREIIGVRETILFKFAVKPQGSATLGQMRLEN